MALYEAAILALGIIAVGVFGYLGKKFGDWYKDSNFRAFLKEKEEIVQIAVNAAEQIFTAAEGSEKFDYAKDQAVRIANDNGISITEVELDNLIESSVTNLKKGFKKGAEIEVKDVEKVPEPDPVKPVEESNSVKG